MVRKMLFAVLMVALVFSQAEARSGCCSWHGGVVGCMKNTDRIVCRDGTYSPSCTCSRY